MITTDAMNELCTLMKSGELTSGVFDDWVSRYYAMPGNGGPGSVVEPRSVESSRGRVRAFDAFLMRPQTVQCRFIDAIIALRNVFALHAGMSTPATIVLGAEAGPSLGDLLRQLIAVPAERAHA